MGDVHFCAYKQQKKNNKKKNALTFSAVMKWNDCVESIAGSATRKVGSECRA